MLTNLQQIEAITWKGRQRNLSYGKMVSLCRDQELQEIYAEYEQMLSEKNAKKEKSVPHNATQPHNKLRIKAEK